jgi:hypothetical protein
MEYDDPLPTTCTREIVGPAGDVMRRASSSAANAYWIYAVGACAIDPKLVSYGEIHCSVVDVKAPGSCMNGIVRGSREVTTDLPWPAACLNVNGTNECASPAVCFENSLTLMGDVRANGDLSVAAGMHVPAGNGGNDIARFYSEQNVCIAGPGRMMAQVASRSNDGVVHVGNNIFFGMLGEQGLGLALLRAAWADGSF